MYPIPVVSGLCACRHHTQFSVDPQSVCRARIETNNFMKICRQLILFQTNSLKMKRPTDCDVLLQENTHIYFYHTD